MYEIKKKWAYHVRDEIVFMEGFSFPFSLYVHLFVD